MLGNRLSGIKVMVLAVIITFSASVQGLLSPVHPGEPMLRLTRGRQCAPSLALLALFQATRYQHHGLDVRGCAPRGENSAGVGADRQAALRNDGVTRLTGDGRAYKSAGTLGLFWLGTSTSCGPCDSAST